MKKRDLKRFKNIPTLKTERLVLRKIKESDFRDVFEYSSDPEVPKYLLWNPHVSKEHTKLYLKNISKLYKRCEFYDWAITYNGKMIGTVGYSSISLIEQWVEIGDVLNRRFWGLGIATEAVKKIIDYAICQYIYYPSRRHKRNCRLCVLGLLRLDKRDDSRQRDEYRR